MDIQIIFRSGGTDCIYGFNEGIISCPIFLAYAGSELDLMAPRGEDGAYFENWSYCRVSFGVCKLEGSGEVPACVNPPVVASRRILLRNSWLSAIIFRLNTLNWNVCVLSNRDGLVYVGLCMTLSSSGG